MHQKHFGLLKVVANFAICQVLAVLITGQSLNGAEPFLRDYSGAIAQAKSSGKLLLLAFHAPLDDARWEELLTHAGSVPAGTSLFEKHVVALLPTNYAYEPVETTATDANSSSEKVTAAPTPDPPKKAALLSHPSFSEMLQRPGFAVLDFTDANSPLFHYVISVLPMLDDALPTLDETLVLLNLPVAPLTQRSLIFAVRTHPSKPQSTTGDLSPILAQEAESHANYQASINLQGHHHWETRFHRINAKLMGGLHSQEVCAESWPRQRLLESAKECVHSWSQSPGHWSAVSGKHPLYGYDMKRGSNGVWYGVGIFGRRD